MAVSNPKKSRPKATKGPEKSPRKPARKPRSASASPSNVKPANVKPAKEQAKAKTRSRDAHESGGYTLNDPAALGQNIAHIAAKSQKLVSGFLSHQAAASGDKIDPLNIGAAFYGLFKQMAADPGKIVQAQFELWKEHLELSQHTARRVMGETVEPMVQPVRGDKRFRHPEWDENQVFNYIKQSYLLTSNWLTRTVNDVSGLESKDQARAAFYARQFVDAIAPTNFVLTNPEVLSETMLTNGENLVRGLDNLLKDIERDGGKFKIRQTTDNFVVGKDIAVTPGKVVFRNSLFELLQYTPTTKDVHEVPLLVFPPWINKYYILDLQPKNSFVKWAVDSGYTVFVVSWVNPSTKLSQKGFEEYMRDGIFAALDAVEKATGQREVNTIGYCIAGTLLSATLAYIAASGEYKNRIKSATFLAAQVDFSEAGELQVFIDNEQLDTMEKEMVKAGGVLEGSKMAMTFNMLRANDLIWSFVVNNYLMGKEPMPFDLLYWNSDTTRMPLKLHLSYLRGCYRDNALAQKQMELGGKRLDIGKIKTPVYFQAAREDHIAPAASVYKGTRLFGGPVTFMLAGSGHIAGVVNPPAAGKYQHWTNDLPSKSLEEWIENAEEHTGSWWPTWEKWLASRSGDMVPSPQPGDGALKIVCDAPGTYVMVKAH
jgi:polyhydroxyalkanoate synthase